MCLVLEWQASFFAVDGTLVIVVESELLLSNAQLCNELFHLDYLLVDFRYGHILGFLDWPSTTSCAMKQLPLHKS